MVLAADGARDAQLHARRGDTAAVRSAGGCLRPVRARAHRATDEGGIAIFDPDGFGERGTVDSPNLLATGMRHVLVNGVATLRDGASTGARAGEVLRGRAAGLRR